MLFKYLNLINQFVLTVYNKLYALTKAVVVPYSANFDSTCFGNLKVLINNIRKKLLFKNMYIS